MNTVRVFYGKNTHYNVNFDGESILVSKAIEEAKSQGMVIAVANQDNLSYAFRCQEDDINARYPCQPIDELYNGDELYIEIVVK